jgi:hypothetical protein
MEKMVVENAMWLMRVARAFEVLCLGAMWLRASMWPPEPEFYS